MNGFDSPETDAVCARQLPGICLAPVAAQVGEPQGSPVSVPRSVNPAWQPPPPSPFPRPPALTGAVRLSRFYFFETAFSASRVFS